MILRVLTAILLLTGCVDKQKNEKNLPPSWAKQMEKTAVAFQELLPFLYNEEKFNDSANKKLIAEKIKNYKENIHQIDREKAKHLLGKDPYVAKSLATMEDLVDHSHRLFLRGDKKNSRILLKATTNACFKCHTRQNLGPQTVTWKNFNAQKLKTNPFEKAQVMVAMRQYDKAQKELIEYITSRERSKEYSMTYQDALTYYLMISLRAKNEISKSQNFLKDRVDNPQVPKELHDTIWHWTKDLDFYAKNESKLKTDIKTAQGILKKNRKSYSEKNLVNNLMASRILHKIIMDEAKKDIRAKAYKLLGQVYDELVLAGFWDLPEVYYELCIDEVPHSALAKKCYSELKNVIVLGYSGSRGTQIPADEYKRLQTIRKKAF